MKDYKRLTQIALEGFTELNMYNMDAGLQVVYLHMSLAKTVPLPADFIDYVRIGIPINGKLRVITRHDNLLLPRTYDDTGLEVGNADNDHFHGIPDAIFFSSHFRNGQYVGGLFGLPGGIDSSYYRIDRERRQIVFSGHIPRTGIVLEYLSSGVKLDGSSLVPREAVPALRTYVEWQMISGDMLGFLTGRTAVKMAYSEIERRKKDHEEAVAELRAFQNSFTADELKRALWGSYRQSPKR
jgi:hypothetical protein